MANLGLLLLLLGSRSRRSGHFWSTTFTPGFQEQRQQPIWATICTSGISTFSGNKKPNVDPFEFRRVWQDSELRNDARVLQEPAIFQALCTALQTFAFSRVRVCSVLIVFRTMKSHRSAIPNLYSWSQEQEQWPILVYYFYSWVPGVEVVANFGLPLVLLVPRSRSSGPYGL